MGILQITKKDSQLIEPAVNVYTYQSSCGSYNLVFFISSYGFDFRFFIRVFNSILLSSYMLYHVGNFFLHVNLTSKPCPELPAGLFFTLSSRSSLSKSLVKRSLAVVALFGCCIMPAPIWLLSPAKMSEKSSLRRTPSVCSNLRPLLGSLWGFSGAKKLYCGLFFLSGVWKSCLWACSGRAPPNLYCLSLLSGEFMLKWLLLLLLSFIKRIVLVFSTISDAKSAFFWLFINYSTLLQIK